MTQETTQPDHILSARYRAPDKLQIQFANGLLGEWPLEVFGIETACLRLPTMRATDDGSAIEVEMKHGEIVQIDAGAIRAAIDPNYAESVRESLGAMRGPIEEI